MRVRHEQNQSFVIGLLCLMFVIGRMSLDIYIPALPTIQHYFLTTEHEIQLSISLFALGFGISQLFYGPLSDRFGRRPIFFIGLILFILGSLFSFCSGSIKQLIIARFITGFGSGAGVVIGRAISRDLFSGKKLASVVSIQTLALTFALFFAPVFGSYLLNWFSWRADFLFLFALGVSCFFFFFVLLPETNLIKKEFSFLDIFVNYKNLLSHWQFISNVLALSFSLAGLVVYIQLTPFIFENQYGLSPLAYSWLSLAVAFAYIVGTLSVNRQLKKHSFNRIIVHGSIAMLVSGLVTILMFYFHLLTLTGILLASMLYIYGLRLVVPSATANSLTLFKDNAGIASALMGAIIMSISSVISFFCTLFHFNQVFLLGLVFAILGSICLTLVRS